MNYTKKEKIYVNHGTYPCHVGSILENNFRESADHTKYYGDGVYFFVEGINNQPIKEYAKQFAIDQCWCNNEKRYLNDEIVVLEAWVKFNPNTHLDLTTNEGAMIFNRYREIYLNKINQTNKRPTGHIWDYDILGLMRKELGIEFVRGNLYIKFASQRSLKIGSIIPNVTILVVNNPNKNIEKMSIKEILRHKIMQS